MAEALRTPAEGQSVRVPYVGSVVGILARIRGHLQSAVSYAGERTSRTAHRKISRDPGALPDPAVRGLAARVVRPLALRLVRWSRATYMITGDFRFYP